MNFLIRKVGTSYQIFADKGDKILPLNLDAVVETQTITKVTGMEVETPTNYAEINKSEFPTQVWEVGDIDEVVKRFGLNGTTEYSFPNALFIPTIADVTATKVSNAVSPTVIPSDATLSAVSADTDVATVSVTDNVLTITAVAAGTSTITVTAAKSGATSVVKTFVFTVPDEILVNDIADVSSATTTAARTITYIPTDATVAVESSDELVCTVAELGGTITATKVSAGTATITATVSLTDYEDVVKKFTVTFTE